MYFHAFSLLGSSYQMPNTHTHIYISEIGGKFYTRVLIGDDEY